MLQCTGCLGEGWVHETKVMVSLGGANLRRKLPATASPESDKIPGVSHEVFWWNWKVLARWPPPIPLLLFSPGWAAPWNPVTEVSRVILSMRQAMKCKRPYPGIVSYTVWAESADSHSASQQDHGQSFLSSQQPARIAVVTKRSDRLKTAI